MIYKSITKKKVFIISLVIIVILGGVAGYILTRPKNNLANKPNPTPGSGRVTASASTEAEQKQQAKSEALNKQLAEAPKDPKARCEITAKFNAESVRNENIALETKRHEAYIKKFGNNRAEDYTRKQNLERIQKQYDDYIKSIDCK